MANRVKVPGHTRADGTKVKAYIRRGPSSETRNTGTRWDKKNNTLVRSKRKRR